MRKASIRQNHRDFEQSLDVLDKVAAKIVNGQIGADANEWNALAEGVALTLAGYWEEVVDEDFVDALNRDTSAYAGRVGLQLPKNLSRDICFGLLVGDGYLDFRDTGQIIGQARKVLVAAVSPFDCLTKTVRTSIDQFYVCEITLLTAASAPAGSMQRCLRPASATSASLNRAPSCAPRETL